MHILGIDYGRKKIGLALADSESDLAEPYRVIRFNLIEEAIKIIEKVVQVEQVGQVVVGISEGKMAEETKNFGKKLRDKLGARLQDEQNQNSQENQTPTQR